MNHSTGLRGLKAASIVAASLLALSAAAPASAQEVQVTNLVSDGAVPAATIDPDLVNPWGLSRSSTSPFWVSDNGAGVSTLYNGAGAKVPLTVTIPPAPGGDTGTPTGTVFNGSGGFNVSSGGKTGSSLFMFSTEDGTISGWSPSVDTTHAVLTVDNSTLGAGGAVYKGLAIGSTGGNNFIYASDFRNGLVEQFDSNFNLVRSFTDAGVAAGYAPFGIQTLNGQLYVTYALQDGAKHDDVAGMGNGYVDVFNLDGTFVKRLVSQGGMVNSPWGLDIAPSTFGDLAGQLLVGNFGDGTISAFDILTGNFLGQLMGTDGKPIEIDGLWALMNGNGTASDANGVYFTAGLNDEQDGLFGVIRAVPEPSTWAMMLLGFGVIGIVVRRRSKEERLPQLA